MASIDIGRRRAGDVPLPDGATERRLESVPLDDALLAALQAPDRARQLKIVLAKQFEFFGMIGRSPLMQELFDTIRRLAPHVRTALISGETGTGKDMLARARRVFDQRRPALEPFRWNATYP